MQESFWKNGIKHVVKQESIYSVLFCATSAVWHEAVILLRVLFALLRHHLSRNPDCQSAAAATQRKEEGEKLAAAASMRHLVNLSHILSLELLVPPRQRHDFFV